MTTRKIDPVPEEQVGRQAEDTQPILSELTAGEENAVIIDTDTTPQAAEQSCEEGHAPASDREETSAREHDSATEMPKAPECVEEESASAQPVDPTVPATDGEPASPSQPDGESPAAQQGITSPAQPAAEELQDPAPTQTETPSVDALAAAENPGSERPSQEPTPENARETVDFSDEDAELDAQSSDLDLGEYEENEGDSPESMFSDEPDLANKNKQELVDLFARSMEEKPIQNLRRDAEAIKVAFYKLYRADVEALRKLYTESGGDPEAFEAPADEQEIRLKDLVREYRRRRDEFLATLEQGKEENLKVKLEIIEELKNLVNGSETLGQTFNTFRDLQQRWRDTGPVPQANVKDLWETYNHHIENFYSYIKINKELRDLDLKKNYEAKVALCEEAEALLLEPSVVTAFHKLQKLHEEWRETGPVSNEYKEAVWERFREASGRINKQHQAYFDSIKEEQKKNLDLKTELCEQTEALAAEPYTTRKEWNQASDKLLELQKVWKTIGFAPKKNNARVYERFRTACDGFFEAKRNFYNQLKTEMEHNLEIKNEICQMAESLQESEDWRKTSDELIALQKRWKETGPVPRRHSDAVWKRFRAACDRFFERKNTHFSGVEGNYKENLEKKRTLLAEAEQKGYEGITFEDIKEFQRKWSEIGFVPIKQKDSIQKQYKQVVDNMFSTLRGGEQERSMNKFRSRVTNLKSSGDKRLRFERERLYNKVRQLEGDIATLENNIGFFGSSKNAESMIADVQEKIERAKAEMAQTIEKIKLIDAEGE